MDNLKDIAKILVAVMALLPAVLIFNDNGNIAPNIVGLLYLLIITKIRPIISSIHKGYDSFMKIIGGDDDT